MSERANRTKLIAERAAYIAIVTVLLLATLLPRGAQQSIGDWVRTAPGELSSLITPTEPSEFWDFVAAAANCALIFVAWRGLTSLGLTRTDMKTRATRDALQCAITRAEEWANEILPANGLILGQLSQHQIPVFVDTPSKVNFDRHTSKDLRAAAEWVEKLPDGLQQQSIQVLNRIEAWAMYFTSGLADQKLASQPCAVSYCSIVVQHYPLLLLMRSQPSSGDYPNAVQLFHGWLTELEKQEMGLQQGLLLNALRELQAKGPARADILPRPIGVDLDHK